METSKLEKPGPSRMLRPESAERVWRRIAEAGRVEILVDLLAFAAIARQHGVARADQIDARAGNTRQRVTRSGNGEEPA